MDIDSFLGKLNTDLEKQRESLNSQYRQPHGEQQQSANSVIHFCPYCGQEVVADGRFCLNCGQELPYVNHNNKEEATETKQKLDRLTIYEELEESSKKCIETFNEIYSTVFEQETNIPLRKFSTDSPQFEYGSQAVALTRVAEIECTKSLYAYFHNGIDEKPKDITFGILIGEFHHRQQRVPKEMKDWNGFIKSLTSLKDDRNAGAHGQKLFTDEMFIEFYKKYLTFYKYMPELLAVKRAVRKKYPRNSKLSSIGVESKVAESDDDYVFPDITPRREKYGVILTDCLQLAIKYFQSNDTLSINGWKGNATDYIRTFFVNDYIRRCKQIGTHYELLDLSEERWGLKKGEKHSWQTILNVLDTYYAMPHNWSEETPALFIIGGDDVIQMPCVANNDHLYREKEEDKGKYIMERDLETDLLYAFSSSEVELSNDGTVKWAKLFNKATPRFYVGRLPMENGLMLSTIFDDLGNEAASNDKGYFNRVLGEYAGKGISIKVPCYVSQAAAIATTQAIVADWPKPNIKDESYFIQQGVFESPGIVVNRKHFKIEKDNDGHVEKSYTKLTHAEKIYLEALRNSDFCFFNTHSGQSPKGGFSGESNPYMAKQNMDIVEDENGNNVRMAQPPAFYPELQYFNNSRVFASICCWGAKFINYTRPQSTLLTGIYDKNLLYMGSSRSAYGRFCPGPDSTEQGNYDPQKDDPELLYAFGQWLIKSYMDYLLGGMDAGKALMKAKMDYVQKYQYDKMYEPIMVLTVLEFNLFGDPLLHVKPIIELKRSANSATKFNADIDMSSFSTVYMKGDDEDSASKKMSLLERVRNLVDKNIAKIRHHITTSLYEEYGLAPRNLQIMQKHVSPTGEVTFILHYQDSENFSDGAIAYTDEKGNVKDLLRKC